eukprot:TRINITY_DN5741_c0_g1_i1.p2 TRINITY_DN5741_c0_g1~~TRINITY_DN5741_c0_g1_i1.p2  ORF type:complete len:446 (+),score=226.67 TRINITY_DN5741_c0_g1_i1:61-1398(+)
MSAIAASRAALKDVMKRAPSLANRKAGMFDKSSKELMGMEGKFVAQNYSPMPVVFSKAEGVRVWDPEGKEYIDFLSAYSATNQGHNNKRICDALKDQVDALALSSRAFYNDMFPKFAAFLTEATGYDMFLPANSGAEAVEAAIKMTRKWGYRVKGIPKDEAVIIVCKENFHGRTTAIVGFSTDPDAYADYGPFAPGFEIIDFNDVGALEKVLKEKGDKVAGFLVEPIQGEAGVFVPDEGYLAKCHALCKEHNVLLMADEVQTGFGRTGKLFCSDYDDIKPEVIVVGKALSGGLYPVSGVLADKAVMGVFTPGTHGSTFGGSPIAAAVGIEAVATLLEEDMVGNSYRLGALFRELLSDWAKTLSGHGVTVRGRGLLNAVEVDPALDHGKFAYKWCIKMAEKGVLAKPTHGNIVRFSPPLVITEEEVRHCCEVISKSYEAAYAEAEK